MTVFLPKRGRTWRYDFWYGNVRHFGNTQQITREDAELAEREIRLSLRHQAGGIAQFFPKETPRFATWAKAFLAHKNARLERPDHVQHVTRVLLRFWGERQPGSAFPDEPYHDLCLGDPIADPEWILKFESWMRRRGIGPQSRNHYRGVLRRMYTLAMAPEHRAHTGITMNPFAGLPTDATMERTVTVEPAELRAWLAEASYHVRLAIAIAALAPKLRLRNILSLEWAKHFAPDPRATRFNPRIPVYIQLERHKTARTTRRALVSPVGAQLLGILKDAYRRNASSTHVVVYRGRPVKSIRDGVKAAAEAAGLEYGRDTPTGVTFHTLRHTAATLLSDVEADPLKLRDAMGHTSLATTLRYRHKRPKHERPALELLSRKLRIADVVMMPTARASRKG